ncbi:MAG: CopG family antitoxin [Thermoleophilaceae bacterium]
MAKRGTKKRVVERPEDIPAFASEDEEAQFWSEHELGDNMLKDMKPLAEDVLPPPRTPARPVSVRFEAQLLQRLRDLASRRGMRYQTLLKQFVLERLYEEEQREGLVRPRRDAAKRGGKRRTTQRKTSAGKR